MFVRDAELSDLESMRAIYARHVASGFGSFEEAEPAAEAFADRWAAVRARALPWLVAEADGRVLGYACASPFRPRSGYRYTVEDSVYVTPDELGRGVGRLLLDSVIRRCAELGLRQMTAVIGDSDNAASIALHRACGFELAGVLRAIGFKHGRWVDVVLMQRALNEGDATPPVGAGWLQP